MVEKAVEYLAILFKKKSSIHDTALEANSVVAHQISRHNKPFSDGNLIKQCMTDRTSVVCPETKGNFEKISLLRWTVRWTHRNN